MLAPEIVQKNISLGFVGVGWIGRNRLEALLKNPQFTATSIFEPAKENAKAALQIAKKAILSDSITKLCEQPDLDGIVIATPSALHAQQSIAAFQAGKAVFCQKPLGRTAIEVKKVIEASQKANKLLAVDLSYRYSQAYQAIYKLIQNQEIGEIYAIDLTFHNAYGPDKAWFYDIKKSGGGCVMDLGIHLIDLALWSLDFPKIKEIKSHLFKQGRKLKASEEAIEDFASISMLSENDTLINLECSWNISAGEDAVISANFYGTRGGASFKNINGSFYDFSAEKFRGTQKETLASPPDDWGGRAAVAWAERLLENPNFDNKTAIEYLQIAEIIDQIYQR